MQAIGLAATTTVTCPGLHFQWKGESWSLLPQRGVQQGGTHSAILFAYVLGLAVEEASWDQPCTFGCAFVDDLLLSLRNWHQAIRFAPAIGAESGRTRPAPQPQENEDHVTCLARCGKGETYSFPADSVV